MKTPMILRARNLAGCALLVGLAGGAGLRARAVEPTAMTLHPLHVDGQNFVDSAGKRVVLRGVNIGGWLVTEDTDTDNMAAADPAHPLTEAYNQAMAGGVTMLHQTKAIDPVCGRGMLPRFNRAGLLELRHEGITMLDQGGGPLCTWYAMSTEGSTSSYEGRNRDQPVSLTLKALNNPDFWLMSGVYHCAWGRKAG